MANTRFLINCLDSAHVSGAYSALKDQGLLVDPEDEDPDTIYVFPDYDTFVKRCNETMIAAKDDPRVHVVARSRSCCRTTMTT